MAMFTRGISCTALSMEAVKNSTKVAKFMSDNLSMESLMERGNFSLAMELFTMVSLKTG